MLTACDLFLGCTHTGLPAKVLPSTPRMARAPSDWHKNSAGLHQHNTLRLLLSSANSKPEQSGCCLQHDYQLTGVHVDKGCTSATRGITLLHHVLLWQSLYAGSVCKTDPVCNCKGSRLDSPLNAVLYTQYDQSFSQPVKR